MSVKLRKKKTKKGYSLYLDIYREGKREYKFLKIHLDKDKKANREKMALAEGIRAKKEIEILNGNYGFTPKFKKKANFVEYFENFCKTKKSSPNYATALKHLKAFTKGNIKFLQVNEVFLKNFFDYLLSKVSHNTAFGYFWTIKTALKNAVKEKIINENHADHIKIKRKEVARTFLTIEDLKKMSITKCQNEDVRRAFIFACYTGLRISDLKNLTWGKIKKNGRYTIEYRQKKTGGFEYFPLSKTAINLLEINGKWENLSQFQNKKVFELPSLVLYNDVLKEWAREAGIKKNISSHVARHTFATMALSSGVDIYTVSKLLGHRSIQTTQVYAKIIDKKKDTAVDMLPTLH